jgi:hypothetical protein
MDLVNLFSYHKRVQGYSILETAQEDPEGITLERGAKGRTSYCSENLTMRSTG